ncbi:hypothetical protein [Urbifossiella limnaea]|uniref:Uncharacterized protein n=1 Tax=Urbifossiella limnaea TaxID=2528023 RepID=A0A517XXV4_9BACT|nr:hypothetical protein [Urbifossiella limnaea]QDU22340.1 hypothetical protein ETAA1_43180 [Urbifossiella limnaea]
MGAVMIGAAVVAVVLGIYATIVLREEDFKTRFPPISDDEFLARCTPGTSRHVALTVRRIVAKNLAIEYVRIHPSMRWVEDIGTG